MDEHTDLYDLLADDREARDLFRSLPDYIQGAVHQPARELRTRKAFRDFVKKHYPMP